MRPEGTVQYNSLSWVKKQLDTVLQDAQSSLSEYIEDSENNAALEQCIEHLRLVYGTLQMVEVYGAAMLAEEMELTAKAQLDGLIDKPEDVYDVLMRAMLQLPDYLEGLQAGNQDAPITLMPLMNDMRAARKEKLLSESVFFLPDVNTVDIEELSLDGAAVESGQLADEAKRLRTHYQLGLVDLLRNKKSKAGLKRMMAVVESLQKVTTEASVKRLWIVIASLLEAVSDDESLESNISVKGLLGGVDRQIKLLIDVGEDEFITQFSQGILKNILYYVGTSQAAGVRVSKVKQAYKLDALLSDSSSADDLTTSMGGVNAELFDAVSQGIREDLATVKDTLEIFMQSSDKDVEQLSSVVEQIEKIGDTYGMLGFGAVRQAVLEQRDSIEKIISGDSEATEELVMGLAGALLEAESTLDDYIAGKAGYKDEDDEDRIVPSSEYRKVLAVVVEEGQKNFLDAKEAILVYARGDGGASQLEIVSQRLEEVRGACMILSADRVAKMISDLQEYVHVALKTHHHQPDADEQDTIADAVTAIEYYFEAMVEGQPGVDRGLQTGEQALRDLDEIVKRFAGVEPPTEEIVESILVSEEAEESVSAPVAAPIVSTDNAMESINIADIVVPDQYEEYEILSDDADEEIVEIFIEEAIEVLGTLHEHVPQWKADLNDDEALTVIRRSFHTLKGSGRLIGAALIGEFSWKVESLLNRVIDQKIEVTDDFMSLIDEVLAVLPQLIEQLKGNREPIPNIYKLMAIADALADGKAIGSVSAESTVKTEVKIEAEVEILSVDDELIPDVSVMDMDMGMDDVLELNGEISSEDEILLGISGDELESESDVIDLGGVSLDDFDDVVLSVSDDEDTIEITSDIDDFSDVDISLQETVLDGKDFAIEIDELSELEDLETVSGLDMDPMLFQIYYDESIGHLQTVKDQLAQHDSGEQALTANKDLIRALHTLFGSARTAEIEAIAEISCALEKYVVAREDFSDSLIPNNTVDVVTEVVRNIDAMLESLKDGKMPESNKTLLDAINKTVRNELQQQLQQSSPTNEINLSDIDDDIELLDELQTDSITSLEDTEIIEPAAEPEETIYTYGEVDDDLIDIFLEEAEELLEDCESTLARLMENENDAASINELQRHMHTLKGGARMAALTPVGDLTHELESMVVSLAENKIEASKAFFDVIHESLDMLSNMLGMVKQRQPLVSASDLVSRVIAIMRGEEIEYRAVERFDLEVEDLKGGVETIQIDEAVSLESLEDESAVELSALAATEEIDPHRRKSDVEDEKPHWGERATDVNFKDSHEQVRVRADLLNNLVNYAGEVNIHHARMGKQMTDISFNLKELDQTVVRLKEQLRKLEIETEIQIRSNYEKEGDDYDENFDPLEMDRYSTLQQLARSLSETASDVDSIKDILSEIVVDSETLLLQESRISTDLQEGLMRTRMVRFGGMSTRLRRIVRQTAREMGKEVDVEIIGEEEEVDRTVLDRVVAPLEHMLRNAVAHGIEMPKDRLASGKSEKGLIRITVSRQGPDIIFKVDDDGAGINADIIRSKAIKQGLLEEDSGMSDREVLKFILRSGFSTAEEVTQISGRGVGMDVVDSEIKQLGGVLEIDTEVGKGSNFRIRLPLTLAINQALLVNAADDIYAVPLSSIEGVIRLTGMELQKFYDSGDLEYEFNGVQYELKHLGFMLTGQQANYSDQGQLFPVLLVNVGDQHFALHVDDLLGRREIVIKSAGVQISKIRGIAGATILADGRVVLILEMSSLVVGESLFKEIITEEEEEVAVDVEPTIMVVDDSITIRKVTARILERHGMRVILATDGVDATDKLQDEIPDLMLLDIEMPRMDGFELATYMRNEDRFKDVPIIMITSRTGAKHKERAKSIGVQQYLGKPYQEDELMKNINALLEQQA